MFYEMFQENLYYSATLHEEANAPLLLLLQLLHP